MEKMEIELEPDERVTFDDYLYMAHGIEPKDVPDIFFDAEYYTHYRDYLIFIKRHLPQLFFSSTTEQQLCTIEKFL